MAGDQSHSRFFPVGSIHKPPHHVVQRGSRAWRCGHDAVLSPRKVIAGATRTRPAAALPCKCPNMCVVWGCNCSCLACRLVCVGGGARMHEGGGALQQTWRFLVERA